MVEPVARSQGEPEGAPAAAESPQTAAADAMQLAQHVAERVYRLMASEARLSRARGQRPMRRAGVLR